MPPSAALPTRFVGTPDARRLLVVDHYFDGIAAGLHGPGMEHHALQLIDPVGNCPGVPGPDPAVGGQVGTDEIIAEVLSTAPELDGGIGYRNEVEASMTALPDGWSVSGEHHIREQ